MSIVCPNCEVPWFDERTRHRITCSLYKGDNDNADMEIDMPGPDFPPCAKCGHPDYPGHESIMHHHAKTGELPVCEGCGELDLGLRTAHGPGCVQTKPPEVVAQAWEEFRAHHARERATKPDWKEHVPMPRAANEVHAADKRDVVFGGSPFDGDSWEDAKRARRREEIMAAQEACVTVDVESVMDAVTRAGYAEEALVRTEEAIEALDAEKNPALSPAEAAVAVHNISRRLRPLSRGPIREIQIVGHGSLEASADFLKTIHGPRAAEAEIAAARAQHPFTRGCTVITRLTISPHSIGQDGWAD